MFRKFFHILAFGIALLPFQIFAQNSLPFSDVPENSPYFQAVKDLYDARVISDDGSHLFHPEKSMNRDFFVSLAVQIGCKECLTPTTEDIIKYAQSPFVDLPKTNQFYYCIAHAESEKITYGYIVDNTGKTSCENGNSYTSPPFCAENSISKIEAVAMLLRRANLWNDQLNSGNFDKSEKIADASDYWYGYAKKGLEIGILTKNSQDFIGQDEKITRGEFALMAAKILEYTQCNNKNTKDSYESQIEIHEKNNTPTNRVVFNEDEDFSLIPKINYNNPHYSWTARNNRGKIITYDTPTFPGGELPPGKWFIDVKIKNPSGETLSNPSVTVFVIPKNEDDDADDDGTKNKDDKCPTIPGPKENFGCPENTPPQNDFIGISLIADPTVTFIGNPITFTPRTTGNTGENPHYHWDFGDGSTSNTPGIQKHPYTQPGIYPVTLIITDPNTGNTGRSTVVIKITDDKDSDGDGIIDRDDQCPLIRGSAENFGCPNITIHDYGCNIRGVYNGNNNCKNNSIDSDGDGTIDNQDKCPNIPGPKENFGCPKNEDDDADDDGTKNKDDKCPTTPGPKENFGCPKNDSDGDGIIDNLDKCPKVLGLPEWNGCPNPNLYNHISQNICLAEKINSQGLITGIPACNTCPCDNNINITSTLRDCDILFPTILSPDKKLIYSRGNFYLLR